MKRPIRLELSKLNLKLIGIPKNFHDKSINDFETYGEKDLKSVKQFFKDYLSKLEEVFETNQGVFLYGSNGVGKTLISCMIVKEAYRHRYTAKRVTFVDYISAYTRLWNARSVEEKETLEDELYNTYKAVEFLVIEEIGKEIDSKVSAPILEDLLRYREDNELVTVVCTNLVLAEVEERYGTSVFSLIKGNMTPVKIEGKDKRLENYNSRQED